ncbi:MAG: chemotaxis protein CheW [Candidatus Wallbacteria bacterium]|nr:chemotaxis protein CheW [Candidatus Wallbacteria bacterium]
MAHEQPISRGSLRPILERLEELIIDAGLSGLEAAGESMALQLDDLSARLEKLAEGTGPAGAATGTATLIRRILSRELPRPHGFSELLLEVHAMLSEFCQGEDVGARLPALTLALTPQPEGPPQPPAPPPDVGRMFVAEATGCLDQVEQALLEMERGPLDAEQLRELARDLHNIKGSAGMAGHEELVSLSHAMENQVLGLLADAGADRARIVDSLLKGLDEARAIVDRLRRVEVTREAEAASLAAENSYLLFHAGGRRLAVSLRELGRVERVPPSAAVPFTPPFVIGLVNLGGELLPLVDLALRLGWSPGEEEPRWVLVVGKGEERIALRVDRVAQVVTFEAACLVAAPSAPRTGELPQTMALDEGEPVPVLDAGRVAAWLGSR